MKRRDDRRDAGQLDAYARDLRDLARRERDLASGFDAVVSQLDAYATDLRSALERSAVRIDRFDRATRSMLERLAVLVDLRIGRAPTHRETVARLARGLGDALGLADDEADVIAFAASIADVGMLVVPERVLHATSPPDGDDLARIHAHGEAGAALIGEGEHEWVPIARQVARTHHECWDGTGYPDGLRGEAIPLAGRIAKLVDCYAAMRGPSVHGPGLGHDEACRVLLEGNARLRPAHFDPAILEAFEAARAGFRAAMPGDADR